MEPERPIEKLLRAFAKKRRDQAGDPMQLRPAARQRLQQEISRRSTAKSGGGFLSNLFLAFRPRLAFALCSIAVLFVGGWFLLASLGDKTKSPQLASANAPSEKTFSQNQPEPMPALAPPPATAPVVTSDEPKHRGVSAETAVMPTPPSVAPATAPTIVPPAETLKQVNVAENDILQTNLSAGITVASAPSSTNPVSKTENAAADSFGVSSSLNKDAPDRALQPIPAPAATRAAPAATPTVAQRDQEKKSEAQKQPTFAAAAASRAAVYDSANFKAAAEPPVASQVYNRLDIAADGNRVSGLVNIPAPVLNSFRLEQNGRDLRVVDADGSVYTGAVQLASPAPAAFGGSPKNKLSTTPPVRTSPQSAAQNYFFTVAGTNRNLNQNVVFSGNLIPLTNALFLRSNAGAIGGALRTGRAAPMMPEPSLLSNSRISGKAVIGNEKEIEVNATPAP